MGSANNLVNDTVGNGDVGGDGVEYGSVGSGGGGGGGAHQNTNSTGDDDGQDIIIVTSSILDVRATQIVSEVMLGGDVANAVVSQTIMEVLMPIPPSSPAAKPFLQINTER